MFKGKERRESRRKEAVVIKFYFKNRGYEIGHGVTTNISESGLAICTLSDVNRGDILQIENHPYIPSGSATVRWAEKENGVVQAGLEYTIFFEQSNFRGSG